MRVLGIDYGDRRIGLAVSDPLGTFAQPLPTLENKGEASVLAAIRALVAEKEVERLVVGLPINMDGSLGPAALKTRDFAEALGRALSLPVETMDERLTSYEAESRLAESGMSFRARRKRVDAVAAALILQSWLDRRPRRGPGPATGDE